MAEGEMEKTPSGTLLTVVTPAMETHARARIAEQTHPQYERDPRGRLWCPTCGLLSPTEAEVRERRA